MQFICIMSASVFYACHRNVFMKELLWMHRNIAYYFRMAVETSRIFSAFLVVHFDKEEVVVQGVKGPKGNPSFQIHFVY